MGGRGDGRHMPGRIWVVEGDDAGPDGDTAQKHSQCPYASKHVFVPLSVSGGGDDK
jgi:hypothetical protein